jgi:ComF family protein
LIELARAAARFLLPSDCLACGRGALEALCAGGVCAGCWESLSGRAGTRCARCDETLPGQPGPETCGRCLLDPPAFESLRAAAPYAGSARDILLAFKFRGADYLGAHLADFMARALPPPEALEIACVPATARARRSRGYHAAETLAAALSRRLGLPLARRRLVKLRETEVQSRLPLHRRSGNVRRAFRAEGRPAESVLLVDDVATSGATARECARQLTEAGARRVAVWCFARASRADVDVALEVA